MDLNRTNFGEYRDINPPTWLMMPWPVYLTGFDSGSFAITQGFSRRRCFILWMLLTSLFNVGTLQGQLSDSSTSWQDSMQHKLYFDFRASSFFKNNEYSNDFTKGFTGIGYMARPAISYYLTEKTQLKTGVFVQYYAGQSRYNRVLPLFSLIQKLNDKSVLILGHINGTLSHRLEEPFFRFDQYYQDNVEYGMQWKWASAAWRSDLWLDWQVFIEPGDTFQEQFQIGWTQDIRVFKGSFEIKLPVQILATHRGGEIITSDEGVLTLLNTAAGLRIEKALSSGRSVSFEPMVYRFDAVTLPEHGVNSLPLDDGTAYYLKLKYQSRAIEAMLGYWRADSFFAPGGESLFHSISDFDRDFIKEERQLTTAKFIWKKHIGEAVFLSLRLDMYYDNVAHQLAHAVGLYCVVNERFFISNLKPDL